jgi:hypothetical protein
MSARKPASRRQNTITRDLGVATSAGKAPSMPRGLCTAAQGAWGNYWCDGVSGVIRTSDHTMVLRWVRNLDRLHRLAAEADRSPMVPGSKGQPKINPIYQFMLKLEVSIREDERQLGIGPYNRLRLGLALSEGAISLAALNAEAEVDDGDDSMASILEIAERSTR